MSHRHLRAIAIGLALVVAPMGAVGAWAAQATLSCAPGGPSAASLQPRISAAARQAAATAGFAALTPAAKLKAVQDAVAAELALSGACPEVIQAALIQAVGSGTISAGVAINIAAGISPEMAQAVATNPIVLAQLRQTGQSATITASTEGGVPVNVLVTLQGAGGNGGNPAPYDPCEGVVAAYCGG